MRVTVITVCYNASTTIDRCIRSILQQSHVDLEYIVIDGGSNDGTASVIERYEKSIDISVSEQDNGIYDAMNKGLRLASGDLIAFLNADDCYIDKNVISDIVAKYSEGEFDIDLGDVVFTPSLGSSKVVRKYLSRRFRPDLLKFGWMPPHPGMFVRREIYDRYGHFDTSYKIAGDFEFVVRVLSKSSVMFTHLDKVVVSMSLGGVSNSSIKNKIIMNKEVLRACRDNGIVTNIFYILFKYPFKFLELFSS